jgi:hypothetical protein
MGDYGAGIVIKLANHGEYRYCYCLTKLRTKELGAA